MASIRLRTRRDGTFYTAVLYVLNGKQTSSSFNDHAEALRFQELVSDVDPASCPGSTTTSVTQSAYMRVDSHRHLHTTAQRPHRRSNSASETSHQYDY